MTGRSSNIGVRSVAVRAAVAACGVFLVASALAQDARPPAEIPRPGEGAPPAPDKGEGAEKGDKPSEKAEKPAAGPTAPVVVPSWASSGGGGSSPSAEAERVADVQKTVVDLVRTQLQR